MHERFDSERSKVVPIIRLFNGHRENHKSISSATSTIFDENRREIDECE
jgi:hypothetical protein